jgi:hypothetical protein
MRGWAIAFSYTFRILLLLQSLKLIIIIRNFLILKLIKFLKIAQISSLIIILNTFLWQI